MKDIAPAGQNRDQDGWADVGAGVLDWRDLWRACRDAGARWMVVEHDKPKDPARSARASFAFLRSIAEADPAMEPMTIGIIGCGNISDAYLKGAARSQLVQVKSCADLNPEAAQAKAKEYGVEAVPVDALLGDPAIDIVINLTVPLAHGPVSLQIVDGGQARLFARSRSPRASARRRR